jgi:flagellar biosynthesis protein
MMPPNPPFAVALAYERPHAPRVVAKGSGELGRKIVETASAHGIPIEENPALAAALAGVELEEHIPPQLYKAVAEVLTFVLRTSARAR